MTANSFEAWKSEVDRLMVAEYAIDTRDAGLDQSQLHDYWNGSQSPSDFVSWFAAKYDLTPLKSWGWHTVQSKA